MTILLKTKSGHLQIHSDRFSKLDQNLNKAFKSNNKLKDELTILNGKMLEENGWSIDKVRDD